jgi:hypothetical protein
MFSPANAVQYYARDSLLEKAENYLLPCYVDLLLLTDYVRVIFVWGQLTRKSVVLIVIVLIMYPKKHEKVYFNCG